MAKYIDANLLIWKIKRQIRMEELNFAALGGGGQTFCINTLEWVLKQIDSLPDEQPSKDLDEATEKLIDEALYKWSHNDEDGKEQYVHDAFIAGAEWQAAQMPMPEDTVLFNKGVAEGKRLMMVDAVDATIENGIYLSSIDCAKMGYKLGDKVKVIIVKEE